MPRGRAVARAASRRSGWPPGAGHDAVAMAALCPVGMLFVRCLGGISHNPAESITVEDADVAARVLIEAVKRLDRAASPPLMQPSGPYSLVLQSRGPGAILPRGSPSARGRAIRRRS